MKRTVPNGPPSSSLIIRNNRPNDVELSQIVGSGDPSMMAGDLYLTRLESVGGVRLMPETEKWRCKPAKDRSFGNGLRDDHRVHVAGQHFGTSWQTKSYRPQGVHLQAFSNDFAFIVTDNTREGLQKLSKFALDKFKDWAAKIKLHVSMEKSSYVLFSKLVRGLTIKRANQPISRKNHLKYLGVTIDHKLGWLPHVIEQGKRAMDQYQHLCSIAGKTWGINKNIRRLWYKTVIERTLCHGAAAWEHNVTSRLQKKLDSIQRLFLLYITGAYRTTPTAAL
ncbi:hypothetical protein AVEN_253905-1 [Araneus ventricosus]|uniref:Reverse transcriptase domain-containing protein n=1 Tax=Araneus ventricosus TaxID=182803 RepID=A0A4Y2EJM2_ARAVE|nr:hypothetical protein AVEN_253905-1 [Araneus ventricosus]